MTQRKYTEIPKRQKCVNKEEPYIGGAEDIIDDTLGKPQSQVNQERIEDAATLDGKIGAEKTRAEGVEGGLNTRLQTVEQLAEISIGGGEAQIATGADFTNPDATKRAKIPTVGAIVDGLNDGVYDVSKRNPTAGPNSDGKFTLEYILSNADTLIPTGWRHGGMTISFVQSSDNKYVQARLMADEFTTDTTQWAIAEESVYVENPEFIYVKTDKDDKILWAIKVDGSIYYGAGVPQQVIDYIEEKIAALSLDEYEDIVAFLNGLEEGDKTLQTLLNEKVDKEEGKSLIDSEYASTKSTIDNPEFLEVTTDSEDKILEGIQVDGTKVIGGGLNVGGSASISEDIRVLGNMEVSGVSYKVVENPEYLAAWLDIEDKVIFGFKADGKTYVGDADFLDDVESIKAFLANFKDKNIDWDALTSITATENPEYIEAKTDSEDKLIAGRTPDGAAFENVGFSTPKVSIDGFTIDSGEDPEGRCEITKDVDNKVISYRDAEGYLHEEAGIITNNLETDNITFSSDSSQRKFKKDINEAPQSIKKYDLPDAGSVNILSEIFYLTYNSGYSDASGVYAIEVYENTLANAQELKVCHVYYVKSSLVNNGDGTYSLYNDGVSGHDISLDLYVPEKVQKINDNYYVKSTLTEIVDPVSGDVSYEVNENSVQVTKITAVPDLLAWATNKEEEHQCVVAVDFGNYLNGNYYMGVKFQGASTLRMPKRNLRFTFYKNSSYKKKLKVKIGEMVRLSGFNLKAFYNDKTRLKEYVLNRVFMAVWEHHPNIYAYPWEETEGVSTGATGMIKSFPAKVEINNSFWGLFAFGLKKDEKNYMLDGDDDGSGVFASNDGKGWETITSYYWSDEMGVKNREIAYPDKGEDGEDSLSVESALALDKFLDFCRNRLYKDSNNNTYPISLLTKVDGVYYVTSTLTESAGVYTVNGNSVAANTLVEFNRENAKEYMDFHSFIDYFICMQVFYLADDVAHNMIFYSGRDKKKFFTFFYDVDASFGGITGDILDREKASTGEDPLLWQNLRDVFKDDMYNRYIELRNTILNDAFVKDLYVYAHNCIPDEWFANEEQKWNIDTSYDAVLLNLQLRLEWLDDYFKKLIKP